MTVYTDRQKADFYLGEFHKVQFNPDLLKLYWDLYKAYDLADKTKQDLRLYRQKNPNRQLVVKPGLKPRR